MILTDRTKSLPKSIKALKMEPKPFFDIKKSNIEIMQPKTKSITLNFDGRKIKVENSDDEEEKLVIGLLTKLKIPRKNKETNANF